MLNRIEEVFAGPHAEQAGTDAPSPIWLEIAEPQRPQVERVELVQRQPNQTVAPEREPQSRAERDAAEQIERDVQRALREPESNYESSQMGSREPRRTQHKDATLSGGNTAAAKPDCTVPMEGHEKATSGSERALEPVITSAEIKAEAARVEAEVSAQVKSDVERALAEAFGEPLAVPGTQPPESEAGAAPRRTRARSGQSLVQRRRSETKRLRDLTEASQQVPVPGADSLGGGWLDGPSEERKNRVSKDQGTLDGI